MLFASRVRSAAVLLAGAGARSVARRDAGAVAHRAASGGAGRPRDRLARPRAQPRRSAATRARRARGIVARRGAGRSPRRARASCCHRAARRAALSAAVDRGADRRRAAGAAQPLRPCRRGRRRRCSTSGLAAGREAVAHIVGRDPESLDEHGVARAAIESLAENFTDGVVAPAFWYAAAGPARALRLQDRQHARQHDRPPLAAAICISAGRRRGSTIC